MSTPTEKASSFFAAVIVLLFSLAAILLAYLALTGNFCKDSCKAVSVLMDSDFDIRQPSPSLPWLIFNEIIKGGQATAPLFFSFFAVISIIAQRLADTQQKLWVILTIVGLCLAGLLSCLLIMFVTSTGDQFKTLRALAVMPKDEYKAGIYWLCGSWFGWFVGIIAMQLNISRDQIAVYVKKWFTKED